MVMPKSNESQSISPGSLRSTQKIPQDATKLNKLPKARVGYMEIDRLAKVDTKKGYFCYNCVYFLKPNHCTLVTDEGIDINGISSGNIAPHGICYLWMPFEEDIK